MNAIQIKTALKTLSDAKLATFVWGAPGVGKSQVVAQVAKELGLQFVDVRAVLLDPVDLRGLPHINGDHKAHWCPPDFLPTSGNGILFLDELNAAPPLVQAACYQLVLDRKLGEYTLPNGWHIVAAGNRESDRAVTHRMPAPLANRFVHLQFDVDLHAWVAWALANNIQTELIAFLRFRPELLHKFDPKSSDKGFPSPRTWEFVSHILEQKPDAAIEFELIKGVVGEGAAVELTAFLKIFRKLPNPDLIMQDPEHADVPKDANVLYALVGALTRKVSEQNFARLVTYINRLPDEFSVMAIRDCLALDKTKALVNTRAYIDWATKHADVLI